MWNRLIHDEQLANILNEEILTHQWSCSIEIFVPFGISFILESFNRTHKNLKTVLILSLIDFFVKMKIMKCILLNLAKMSEDHHSKEIFTSGLSSLHRKWERVNHFAIQNVNSRELESCRLGWGRWVGKVRSGDYALFARWKVLIILTILIHFKNFYFLN